MPRGKAIWNANGGFVSVLLTHLFFCYFLFHVYFLYNFNNSNQIWEFTGWLVLRTWVNVQWRLLFASVILMRWISIINIFMVVVLISVIIINTQANSASYPQRDGKWVVATAAGWRHSVADWGDGVSASASCTMGPISAGSGRGEFASQGRYDSGQ